MEATIQINRPGQNALTVLVTKDAVHEEEMMVSDFVKLAWNDAMRYTLPVGSYIEYGGVKYRLFEEYQPEASGECTFKYTPQFESPAMWLKHIPYLRIEETQATGTDSQRWATANKRSEWMFSGYVRDLVADLLRLLVSWGTYVDTAFGSEFSPSLFLSNGVTYTNGAGDTVISISFSAVDVWSALSQLSGQLDCEFHIDLAAHRLYVGTIETGESASLTVGSNVSVPRITRNKESYCNRYVVHGGTRNMTQESNGKNFQSFNRLTLPNGFTDSVIDLRSQSAPDGVSNADWNAIKAPSSTEPAITGELVLDDVYPKVTFYIYDLKERTCKRKIDEGVYSETETYSKWYVKLASRTSEGFSHPYVLCDKVAVTVEGTDINSYAIFLDLPYNASYLTRKFTLEGREGSRPSPDFGVYKVTASYDHYGTLHTIELFTGCDSETEKLFLYGNQNMPGFTPTKFLEFIQWTGIGETIYITHGIDSGKVPVERVFSNLIAGNTLQMSFLPNYESGSVLSPLAGRTFDVAAFDESDAGRVEAGEEDAGAGMTIEAGMFRIIGAEENSFVIPTDKSTGLCPQVSAESEASGLPDVKNNIVSLIGIKAPDEAIDAARRELLATAIAAIRRKRLDNNTYTVNSYPHVFKANDCALKIGQAVTFNYDSYSLSTHVRKLVTRLDFPEAVEITIGNEKHKGPISSLKEMVNTTVYYGGGVSAPSGGSSPSSDPSSRQTADRLTGNTPHRVWGQPYWQNGVPNDVSGSLSDVENILMDGFIEFGSNSRIYEDSDRKLKLRGYNGIEIEHNLFLGTDLAIKTAAVGENGTDLLAYKSRDWGGVTGAHWFVGVAGVDGFIRSDGELKRWANNENQYTIWDSSNLTPSNYLARTGDTLKGTLTFALPNGTHYGAIQTHTREDGEYLYLWGNDGVLIDGLSIRKDNTIVPIEDVFLNLSGGTMEPGATITLQEIVNNIPVQTLVASQRWVNAQGFLKNHQSLANYVTLDGTETITGQKTFGGIVNLQSDVYVTPTGTLYLQTYDSASRPVSSPAASQSWVSSQGFLTSAALSGYATTNQLDTGLAAKQNKIHFLNRNNNNTESDFSYLYLPLRDVNSGYAELDCVPVTGMNSFFLKSQLGVDNYPSRVGHAVGMQSKLNQYGTGDNGVRGGVYFMFGRSSNSSQDVFERININCLAEYKSDDYNSNYGLSITPTALTFLGNTVYHAGNASSSIVTLSDQQTISGAKTFSADVTHSGTSKAKFGSLSSIYENSSNVLVLTGGNGIELNDDTNVGNGYQLTFNTNNGVSNLADSNSDYLLLWGADGVIIDDAAFIRENNELWKLATEDWVGNCIGSAATLTIAQVTSSDQKVVTSGMTFTAYNGTYLLKGNGNNNGKIVLRARFTASETCLVKVTLTASSEQNYDFGVVGLLDDDDLSSNSGSIGNKILAKASGNNTIVTKFVEVSSGDHYFEIGYVKDGSQSTYDDCATIKIEKVRTAFDCLPISGGTMTGDLNLGANKLMFQNGHIENTTQDGGYMHLLSYGGQFHFHGVSSAYGTCVAAAFTQSSDVRLKETISHLTPDIEDIAAAPVVTFRWKDGDGNENLGSLAQYWQTVFPQAVHEDADGHLSMEYGTIALASAVTAARKAVALEQRVSELERLLATK